jgi:hypothetical protein
MWMSRWYNQPASSDPINVSFDGATKVMSIGGTTSAFTALELYQAYTTWATTNTGFPSAFTASGDDPTPPGGLYRGSYFFLENGWKVRPREASHTLIVQGNLFTRDGSSPFTATLGGYTVAAQVFTTIEPVARAFAP